MLHAAVLTDPPTKSNNSYSAHSGTMIINTISLLGNNKYYPVYAVYFSVFMYLFFFSHQFITVVGASVLSACFSHALWTSCCCGKKIIVKYNLDWWLIFGFFPPHPVRESKILFKICRLKTWPRIVDASRLGFQKGVIFRLGHNMLQFVLIMLCFSSHRMTVLCIPNCAIMLKLCPLKSSPSCIQASMIFDSCLS